jgi:hypothetical protein
MNAPMVGNWAVEVKAVRPFTIHGDLDYELDVMRLDDQSGMTLAVRVPHLNLQGRAKTTHHAVAERADMATSSNTAVHAGRIGRLENSPTRRAPGD